MNSAPQKVILYNARHRPVKTVYLIGDQRKKTTTGIQGTLVVANKVRPDSDYRNLRPVRYFSWQNISGGVTK